LVCKAVRLSCLHGIWSLALPEQKRTRQEPCKYASEAVHRQIGIIVSQGIEALEQAILAEVQSIIFNSKGPGKLNMLPIWICLWLLILIYRRTILGWSTEDSDGRLALAQHMYEMLISIYSGLFRPSCPLWLNFLRDDIFELFGRDPRVVERMGTLKTEMGFSR